MEKLSDIGRVLSLPHTASAENKVAHNDIWYTNCPLPAALSIAVHSGLLAAKLAPLGINVHSLRQSASNTDRLSHFRHTVAGQIRHGGHIPPLWSRAEGRDVRLLGLSWTRESQLVLTLPGSGIASIQELAGRRLAVPVRSALPIDFWRAAVLKGWCAVLRFAGLSASDVHFVEIPVATSHRLSAHPQNGEAETLPAGNARWTFGAHREEALALLRDEVDAVFSPGHYGVPLQAFLGLRSIFDLTEAADRHTHLNNATLLAITMDGGFLDARPQAAVEVLVSLFEAAGWARNNHREARRILAADTGNPEEFVDEIFGADFADRLRPTLSGEALAALSAQNRFLFENGFIPRIVPAEEWLVREPLEEALRIAAPAARAGHAHF